MKFKNSVRVEYNVAQLQTSSQRVLWDFVRETIKHFSDQFYDFAARGWSQETFMSAFGTPLCRTTILPDLSQARSTVS